MGVRQALALCILSAGCLAAYGQGSSSVPPVLESEVVSVAKLRPIKARDLLVSRFEGGLRIIDGDTIEPVAHVYTSMYANFALAPDNKFLYVTETYWSRGNRGTRQDLLSVYNGDTLNLVAEIPLPGRLISDPKTRNFDISPDGRYGYVYNFQPAASVVVVDLTAHKVVESVEIPGCGLVFPWGERGFASLCADGTMAVANAGATGKYSVSRTPKFFDVDNDPIFDESLVDRHAGQAFFVSYTGLIYQVALGDKPKVERPWSMQRAARLAPATTQVGHITWRPAGSRLATYHRGSGRLFVLMHEGTHWDYAQPGTEIWVLDTRKRSLISRLSVPQAAGTIAVTQDDKPVLYALSERWLWVLDPDTGAVVRTVSGPDASLVAVRDF